MAWIGAGGLALAPTAPSPRSKVTPTSGSLAWGMAFDGFRPDGYDVTGALTRLFGVAVIMYSPRAG